MASRPQAHALQSDVNEVTIPSRVGLVEGVISCSSIMLIWEARVGVYMTQWINVETQAILDLSVSFASESVSCTALILRGSATHF